jgi:hypothetical protein
MWLLLWIRLSLSFALRGMSWLQMKKIHSRYLLVSIPTFLDFNNFLLCSLLQLIWSFCILLTLQKLLNEDGFYTIRLPSNVLAPTGEDFVYSSIKAVSWVGTNFRLFILTLLLLNVLIFIMDWNLLEHTSNYT